MRDHHTILTDNILVYDLCCSTSMTLDDERTMDSCFENKGFSILISLGLRNIKVLQSAMIQ